MCGLNGITWSDRNLIDRMNEATLYRGPDHTDVWGNESVTFGFNLLNISKGDPNYCKQPYVTRKGNVLMFNGQIYNHGNDLDTHYLGEMMDYYGIEYLKNVDGAFAVAWYNKKNGMLYLARDHYGQRPLFFSRRDGEGMCFSSSLFGMAQYVDLEIDQRELARWQSFARFWPGWSTPYKRVQKMAPGTFIVYDTVKQKYVGRGTLFDWQICEYEEPERYSDDYVRQIIRQAIKHTVYNPNKTAITLSGGLDSSAILNGCITGSKPPMEIIATTAEFEKVDDPIRTEERYYTEEPLAVKSAEYYNIPLYPTVITRDMIEEKTTADKTLMPYMDAARLVPRHHLCKTAAEHGCRVIVWGDGGDEIFSGLNNDHVHFRANNEEQRAVLQHEYYRDWFPEHVLGNDQINNHLFMRLMLHGEGHNMLTDQLAMSFGIESRAPFAYQSLVRLMFSIPGKRKLRILEDGMEGIYKYYLRHLFREELPEHVVNRRTKVGFATPWNSRDDVLNRQRAMKEFKVIDNIVASEEKLVEANEIVNETVLENIG